MQGTDNDPTTGGTQRKTKSGELEHWASGTLPRQVGPFPSNLIALLTHLAKVFWQDDMILREVTCEEVDKCGGCLTCNNDQQSFKAYFLRWCAVSAKWAPWMLDVMQPYFESTAQAVALSCDPSDPGAICGQRWDTGSFFNQTGPGQQMCALSSMNTLLIDQARAPVTAKTGGTSKGDPSAGTAGDYGEDGVAPPLGGITTADRAGAGVLTALVIVGMLCGTYWMVV